MDNINKESWTGDLNKKKSCKISECVRTLKLLADKATITSMGTVESPNFNSVRSPSDQDPVRCPNLHGICKSARKQTEHQTGIPINL
jgi:hypothetical protein